MKKKRVSIFSLMTTAAAVLVFSLLATGCEWLPEVETLEYVLEEACYQTGETCTERYELNAKDGTYKRYIAGEYYGHTLPGYYYGTLFETGNYEVNAFISTKNATFYPKKQYDFDTKSLVSLGIEDQIPFKVTLTDTELIIYWEIPSTGEIVPWTYSRRN